MVNIWDNVVPETERERLLATGFGAGVRLGRRPCLLVVDVTLSFLGRRTAEVPSPDNSADDEGGEDYVTGCGPEGWRRLPAIVALLESARRAGIPRVLTRGSPEAAAVVGGAIKLSRAGELARRTHQAPFPAEIVPQPAESVGPGEPAEFVLEKTKASAFFGTPLLTYLHQHQVDSLIVVGTTTSGCVRATVVDGASYGYPVLVAEDACFDRSPFAHAANLFDIQMKYGGVTTSERLLAELSALHAAPTPRDPSSPDEGVISDVRAR
ncbi:isochorismatase family protein [Streptomyces sp. NPDC005438]|uniref:isochorismatase family protein n=1 Tax=Streptomyces sp. NPDC005438 TaxID=3156880 RepID=UPI0033AA1CDC